MHENGREEEKQAMGMRADAVTAKTSLKEQHKELNNC